MEGSKARALPWTRQGAALHPQRGRSPFDPMTLAVGAAGIAMMFAVAGRRDIAIGLFLLSLLTQQMQHGQGDVLLCQHIL